MPMRLLLLLAATPACAVGQVFVATQSMAPQHVGFRVDPDVAVRIHNLTGQTRIVGWMRDSIDVVAEISDGGGRLYAGGSGGAAKIGVERGPTGTGEAILIVRVPVAGRIWVKSESARVEIEGLRGEIEVNSVVGAISLRGVPRVARLETIDGAIETSGAVSVLRIRTGSGTVRIDGARGNVTATTVQGRIDLTTAELFAARLESVSGAVGVRGAVAPGGRLEIETHDGDVRLDLVEPVDARLDLESVEGLVTTAIDGVERRHPNGRAMIVRGGAAKVDRGALVRVRSFKGSIRVGSNPKR